MPRYFYTAQSFKGESKTGVMEAKDAHQLAGILRQEGLILVRAELEEKLTSKFNWELPSFGVSLQEKLFFTRNLQVMISAGLPLPRAIGTLAEQAKSNKFKNALSNIRDEIAKGKSFSDSLAEYPDIFSELFRNLIKVGEESGTLDKVLDSLSLQIEKEHDLRAKVKGAMIYPAVIIFAMFAVGILMLVVVVPKLAESFKEVGADLPLTTKFIIGFADFLVNKWYLLIIGFLALLAFLWQLLKTRFGKNFIDWLLLKVPVISQIIKNTNYAYTVRTLSSLISSGVALPRSLEITSQTLGNAHFKAALREAAERVRKGEKLSDSLKLYQNIYSPIVIQMIAVGEETGETSGILAKLADFYENEVSVSTKNLTAVIEPVLMLVIGVIVGFFAISMIQPMYTILGEIK